MDESKKNLYELSYWLKGDLSEEESQAEKETITAFLDELKGEISEASLPSKKTLAYPINHYKEGYFGFLRFALEPVSISNLKSKLDANKNILRFLIVIHDEIKVKPRSIKKEKKPEEIAENIKIEEKSEPKLESKEEKEISFEELDKKLEEILKD